jgi:hypothetical protein
MGILHKTFVVITIKTDVCGAWIVTSYKKALAGKIILALADKCCYNMD